MPRIAETPHRRISRFLADDKHGSVSMHEVYRGFRLCIDSLIQCVDVE